jgi:hypothetical protein
MSLFKTPPIRSKAITSAAKGQTCTLRLWCCPGGTETTVFAHSDLPMHGKGMGRKSDDIFGCDACGPCHDEFHRRPMEYVEQFHRAMAETLIRRVEMGIIAVKK